MSRALDATTPHQGEVFQESQWKPWSMTAELPPLLAVERAAVLAKEAWTSGTSGAAAWREAACSLSWGQALASAESSFGPPAQAERASARRMAVGCMLFGI